MQDTVENIVKWDDNIKRLLTDKEYSRISNEYDKVKFKCKHCGHKMVMPVWVPKRPCTWCGYNVYRDEKLEFIDNVKKLIKVV